MEVHKHPHHAMQKKHWHEYLLEFFMIFLAVFLGFEAENIRERTLERHREMEYIHSMVNDLKTDTTKLGLNIVYYHYRLRCQDTLKELFSMLDKGFNKTFYKNLLGIQGYPDFIYTDATIQQLKNSGGFRLIRNLRAIDSIMAYDAMVKKALVNETLLSREFETIEKSCNETFNYLTFDEKKHQGKTLKQLETEKFDFLLTHDKKVMVKYYNGLSYYNWLCNIVKENMKELKLIATRLITFLQKEYQLENKRN
jgi:hypothetical protein